MKIKRKKRKFKVKIVQLPRFEELSEEEMKMYELECSKHIKPTSYIHTLEMYNKKTIQKIKQIVEKIDYSPENSLVNLYNYNFISNYYFKSHSNALK
ncbi:hypothetical protein [Methanocaldococcus sp.]|uniref:hypothetical protein n=1 Tax=Methanocaldococcus sp. TaxID=2152917 RepID=UPI00261660E2|nr:hypothetical protein [Methanocaldococcus sp.]MCQ6254539.1 hypothetical protein [Methanocaldococcus sp.]